MQSEIQVHLQTAEASGLNRCTACGSSAIGSCPRAACCNTDACTDAGRSACAATN